MKKLITICLAALFVLGASGFAMAGDVDVHANEGKLVKEFRAEIPDDHVVGAEELHDVWMKRKQGNSDAYLIDVRTDSEYRAFHIEGTDHIQAGHWYHIPDKIKDPSTPIYIWCRTQHRGIYVTGLLYKIGYNNVYLVEEGILGWAKQGYPFVNKFTGNFKITGYRKSPSKFETEGYKVREWPLY